MKTRKKPWTRLKSRNPELSAFMQKCRGERTIDEIGKAAGILGYYRNEKLGYLPRDPAKIQKIADVLGCKAEELTALVKPKETILPDILPIIKVIVGSSHEGLAMEELNFLLEMQRKLPTPMTPQLIQELLTNHRASKAYVIGEPWPSE